MACCASRSRSSPRPPPRFAPVAMALGVDRHPLRRGALLRPERHEAPGRVYQRQPPGLRPARHLCLEHAGAAGRGHADAGARPQHWRPVHSRRRAPGAAPYPRHAADRWVVGERAAHRRDRHVLRDRLARAARARQFRRRVPGSLRHLSRRQRVRDRRDAGVGGVHHLRARLRPAGFSWRALGEPRRWPTSRRAT